MKSLRVFALRQFNCCFLPLFAYSSYNFYGAAIYIKAVYSQNVLCKAIFSQKFLSENFDPFGLCPSKNWVDPNNIITNAH